MSGDELSLFPEMEPPAQEAVKQVRPPVKGSAAPVFLPGLRAENAYPQLDNIAALAKLASECSNCGLRAGCQQVVFAEGPENARLMLIGEGPGAEEDEAGLPFVGRAGQLLNKILAACQITREEVYITNVVKCRPPGNRLPNPDEVKSCVGYLEAQIRIIKPAIIVCLGALATQTVVDPKARITSARGIWYQRAGIQIMPTFHPAALLRREEWKKPAWEDFKKIRATYRAL